METVTPTAAANTVVTGFPHDRYKLGTSSAGNVSKPARAALRKPNRCCGDMSCRRATLGHDPVQSHPAGVSEHGESVGFDMLVEPQARTGLGQDRGERGIAHLQRVATEVVAVGTLASYRR